MKKKEKAVIITGASKRLGFALAKKSLSLGYGVIAHYRRSPEPLKRWCSHNRWAQKHVHFIQSDLNDDPGSLIDTAAGFPVQLVGLVNNASLFTPGSLEDNTHLHHILRVNVLAPIVLSTRFKAVAGKGWIINLLDAQAHTFNKNFQNYRISKLFLAQINRQLAFLFGPTIRVNAIAPGALLPAGNRDRSYFDGLKQRAPLRRNGDIPSLLEAYAFLINNRSCTGQIIYIDNGLHL